MDCFKLHLGLDIARVESLECVESPSSASRCYDLWLSFFSEIGAQVRELQNKRKNLNRADVPKENERVGLNDVGGYDDDIYTGTKSKFEGYHTSLAFDEADVRLQGFISWLRVATL